MQSGKQKVIFTDTERARGVPKFHMISHGDGSFTLKRLYGAKGYPACDQCLKNEQCPHYAISEALGYLVIRCDIKPFKR